MVTDSFARDCSERAKFMEENNVSYDMVGQTGLIDT
jgi:hypothetical protein